MKNIFPSILLICVTLNASAQWTTSGTHIYNLNSGNVGIGLTSPSSRLHVVNASSDAEVATFEGLYNTNSTVNLATFKRYGGAVRASFQYTDAGTDMRLGTTTSHAFSLMTDNTTRFTIGSSGNIGIGIGNPGASLDIAKSGDTYLYLGPAAGSGVSKTANLQMFSTLATDGTNRRSTAQIVAGYGGSGSDYTDSYLKFQTLNSSAVLTDAMTVTNGRVGIGTSNPGASLDIAKPGDTYLYLGPAAGSGVSKTANLQMFSTLATDGTNRRSTAQIVAGYGGSGSEYTDSYLKFQTLNSSAVLTDVMTVTNGSVGIGTITPAEKLSVNGNVSAKKLIVTQSGWSDYVFNDDYGLRSLSSLEAFIKQNKHLPEVPSAKEVEENGISVGDNQALLLKKIEELTLYIIDQNQNIIRLTKRVAQLEANKKRR